MNSRCETEAGQAGLISFRARWIDANGVQRTITALKQHDEKIRVVLNKADTVGPQELMRV